MTASYSAPSDADDLLPLARVVFETGDIEAAHATMQAEMEKMSEKLRAAVLKCAPKQLIGFFWGQLLMGQIGRAAGEAEVAGESKASSRASLDDVMFALEYVHAVLSSHKMRRGRFGAN